MLLMDLSTMSWQCCTDVMKRKCKWTMIFIVALVLRLVIIWYRFNEINVPLGSLEMKFHNQAITLNGLRQM